MKKYLIVDTQNLFMRALHSGTRGADSFTKMGLSLHIAFNAINNVWQKFDPDHVIFCAEGRSWRKDYDASYKRNRSEARAAQSPQEKEEMSEFFEMVNDFCDFIDTKTNCTFLQHKDCEADDLIAGWIQTHPDDMNYIISTDKDFHQLLNFNVQQYNPISELLYTVTGVFDKKGRIAKDKKGIEVPCPDPEFSLFEKCVRGDKGDNVFPAYPGARMKSSKKAVGITEAYSDREKRGYSWNSFMNVRFPDKDSDADISVKTAYERNLVLVDLTAQPQYIKDEMFKLIEDKKSEEIKKMVGVHFLRFTEKYLLKSLQQFPDKHVSYLSAKY